MLLQEQLSLLSIGDVFRIPPEDDLYIKIKPFTFTQGEWPFVYLRCRDFRFRTRDGLARSHIKMIVVRNVFTKI